MYGVAAHYLGIADNLPIIRILGEVVSWIALGAWAVVFVAMIAHLADALIVRPLHVG